MQIPEVGSVVKVVTRYPNSYYYSDAKYEFNTHQGRVVKADSWLQADEFVVDTGNSKYPKSVIRVRNIHSISYISGGPRHVRPNETRQFKITSKSSNKQYTVSVSGLRANCDCPGFQFRRNCKHTDAVLKKIGAKIE
jgi:hypothetical protein